MSTFKANTITNTSDDGGPDFSQGLNLSGVDITTTVNMTEFYSQASEPSSPANGAVWWDGTSLYQYVNGQWLIVDITLPPYTIQGSISGYSSGGSVPGITNVIDKFPFASDANATDVGDLTLSRYRHAGQSSTENGYNSGGFPPTFPLNPGSADRIDKFPFAADVNATIVGNLTQRRKSIAGQSSEVSGYTSGGEISLNTIDKFPFAADANATDVGDLTLGRGRLAGQSSSENGYNSGGNSTAWRNTIDKFPFASDANATDVGDLTLARVEVAGQSSSENGYTSGGRPEPSPSPTLQTIIDKFPFASDANATDVGDLTQGKNWVAGQSSTVSGYNSGGFISISIDVIEKFPFAVDANATDVGDLLARREGPAGQQV